MINFLFGLVLGAILGGIGVFLYAKKVYKSLQTKLPEVDLKRATVNAIVNGEEPKGDFIKINRAETYLREHFGDEVSIGEVVEDENI